MVLIMIDIKASEFKHRITIQRKTESVIDYMPVDTWEDLFTTRAKIKNVSGYEAIINQNDVSFNKKRLYIRYSNKYRLNNNDRVLYDGLLYNITYVSDVEDLHKYYEIVCEIVEDGEDIGD